VQLGSSRRNRRNLNSNVKIQPFAKYEASIPIKFENDKKSFIDWKAIAINSSDLNEKEKEILGFSPPYAPEGNENQPQNSNFKSKQSSELFIYFIFKINHCTFLLIVNFKTKEILLNL
jgi:hypothetical protein